MKEFKKDHPLSDAVTVQMKLFNETISEIKELAKLHETGNKTQVVTDAISLIHYIHMKVVHAKAEIMDETGRLRKELRPVSVQRVIKPVESLVREIIVAMMRARAAAGG